MQLSRRNFIGGMAALGAFAGCRTSWPCRRPDLVFGVVSDIHLTTPESCWLLERSFLYFRDRGVDAVMIPGDLSDYGTKSGWELLKCTWDRVFAGTGVVPLFCTGNHDRDGWTYDDMAVDMRANGCDGRDAVKTLGIERTWEEVFGEPWEPIGVKSVKGYDFISVQYGCERQFADWMAAHGDRFRGAKPFFHFQHLPEKGTTFDSFGWADRGVVKPVLERYPNCISFTGHTHTTFNDERAIWQGGYTVVSSPSLSYVGVPKGYENGGARRDGTAENAMPMIPDRLNLRGGQGFVVSVFGDEMVVERRDLEEGVEGGEAWLVPLVAGGERPFGYEVREKRSKAPEFPAGAKLRVRTGNTENRQGKWTIVIDCRFPSATIDDGTRVCDYEIAAVPVDGSKPLVKRFLSPAFARLARFEPAEQHFWFDVRELPTDCDFVLEVRARNCFGRCSRPLVSEVRRRVLSAGGVPGKAK